MQKKRFFQTILFIAILTFFLFPAKGFSQTLKNVPYDNPVYLFLDKAYAKSWIRVLHTTRPYTEKKVYELLKEVESTYKSSPEKFLPLDIKELELNLKRIQGDKFSLLKTGSDKFSLGINLSPYITSNVSTGKLDGTATASVVGADISLDVTASKYLYLGLIADVYLILETGEGSPYSRFTPTHYADFNMMTYNITGGGDDFNHLQTRAHGDTEFSIRMNQLNQMTIDAVISTITLGRNSLSWGPSNFANMALSSTSKPYEYITFDIPFGEKVYFTWMTGFLKDKTLRSEDDGRKIISAHRIEWQVVDWFMVSLYETVVYESKLELAYIIPFSLFYIAEVAQGDYDNKQAGIDFVFRVPRTIIYFSFFVDDWNFGELFKASYFHNEMGITLGARHYDLLPGLTISAEYTYLNQWMYTHKMVNKKRNNYTHYGSPLGHVIPPNSHIIYIDFRYDFSTSFTAGISGWFFQHGYGDTSVHAEDDDGPGWNIYNDDSWDGYYNYLDFGIDSIVKETAFDITLYGEYRLPFYGLKVFASWSTEYFYNKSWINPETKEDKNRDGKNEWRNSFSIGGKWQAY